MSELKVQGLHRTFGSVTALEGMEFDVAEGEFFCLLGPSSSGKTTTLRAIAGLEELDSGTVHFDGLDVTDAPIQGRGMSMIFQTFALYPHLSVEANLAHPLRRSGMDRRSVRHRVGEVAELLRVTHTLKRKPPTLSGGEQQRVAIGRAIVLQPKLLLLDEPLTNLDAKLRHDMRAEFKRLHRELGLTMLYATPDQLEALTMGERVGVMREGKVVALGTPRDLYQVPQDTYVAGLVGSPPINLLAGTGTGDNHISVPFLDQPVAAQGVAEGVAQGQQVTLGLRPHDILLANGAPSASPVFTGRIQLTEPLGDVTILDVSARDSTMKMVLREEIAARYAVGEDIQITFDPRELHIFDQSTGTRLNNGAGK
jgi:multiple sugar transport system ATP-binding protein